MFIKSIICVFGVKILAKSFYKIVIHCFSCNQVSHLLCTNFCSSLAFMKIRLLIALLALVTSCKSPIDLAQKTDSQKLVRFSNWSEAVKTSQAGRKNLIVLFSTQWCPYCKYIEENVFNKEDVAKRLQNYTLLNIDGDKKENQELMDKWNISGFPTFIILDSQEKEIIRFNDINSSSEFIAYLDKTEKKDTAGIKEDAPAKKQGPEHYKSLAASYSSNVLKEKTLKKAARIIEDNISNFSKLDEGKRRITLDQHVDLLADIYKDLKDFPKIDGLYSKAGDLTKEEAELNGGIKNNLNLIGTVTYFYLNAKQPDKAIDFLKKSLESVDDYWPVYTNYAKALLASNKIDEAIGFAEKGYSLALEVAKPRAALVLAECYIAKGDNKKAIETLEGAEKDLKNSDTSRFGRAAKMLKQLEERIKEYNNGKKDVEG